MCQITIVVASSHAQSVSSSIEGDQRGKKKMNFTPPQTVRRFGRLGDAKGITAKALPRLPFQELHCSPLPGVHSGQSNPDPGACRLFQQRMQINFITGRKIGCQRADSETVEQIPGEETDFSGMVGDVVGSQRGSFRTQS